MFTIPAGVFDRRMLDQDRFWVTRHGQVLALADMRAEHLLAVTEMLQGKAMWLHLHAMIETFTVLAVDSVSGVASGERLAIELTGESICDLEPHQWLATTALMRALTRRLDRL